MEQNSFSLFKKYLDQKYIRNYFKQGEDEFVYLAVIKCLQIHLI